MTFALSSLAARARLAAVAFLGVCSGLLAAVPASAGGPPPDYAPMVARYARQHGVPERLIHRIIMRESRYSPRVVSKGNYGLMQIRLGTARGMGYAGGPQGLLDPEVNMRHAVPYLANAYITARGDEDLAVRYYAGGYYYAAKRQGLLGRMRTAHSGALKADAGAATAKAGAVGKSVNKSVEKAPDREGTTLAAYAATAPKSEAAAAMPESADAAPAPRAAARRSSARKAVPTDAVDDEADSLTPKQRRADRKSERVALRRATTPAPEPRPVEAAEPAAPAPVVDAMPDRVHD